MKKLLTLILTLALCITLFAGCGDTAPDEPVSEAGWYATWGNATFRAPLDRIPSDPSLKENTVRQQLHTSLGGDKIKLTVSNEYGDIPLEIESMHIAKMANGGGDDSTIDTSTDTVITFGGKENVTVEAGQVLVSDEISFSFSDLEVLAVTMKLGKYVGGSITMHGEANANTWIAEGNRVSDASLEGSATTKSWYYISQLSVRSDVGTKTVVCIGDSITDGVGSTANGFATWPEFLAKDLIMSGYRVGVVNRGISGDSAWGNNNRFERDVLGTDGVAAVIVKIGINDIGGSEEDISQNIIEQYKQMIEKAHGAGIKIYGATMVPIGKNWYYSELHEQIRVTVNEYIRSENSGFDGYIDMDKAIDDPDNPGTMKAEYAVGLYDYLHPGDAGYEVMGKTAADKLLEVWNTEK